MSEMQSADTVDITVHEITKRLMAWKEALAERMLWHWDPRWGMPSFVEGPSNASVPLYDTLRMPWEQRPNSASVSVLGLAAMLYGRDGEPRSDLRVRAVDHLGPDNWPLPPEGPFPLPSDEQWQSWREHTEREDAMLLGRLDQRPEPPHHVDLADHAEGSG